MSINRRLAILGLSTLALSTHAMPARATRAGTAFGTTVHISVAAGSVAAAEAALDAGFAEIRAIERAFSLFDIHSEISELNRTGRLPAPSPLMRDMLDLCGAMWRATQGAFDPTVQSLWRNGRFERVVPSGPVAGWIRVGVARDAVAMPPGVALTFNGIAQGLAADRVLAVLTQAGASEAVIDTGEIGVSSCDAKSFAIAHPRMVGAVIGTVELRDGFLATSGDYMTRFTADFSEHHIINPRTGRSPGEVAAVTVRAPTGAMADALATAFMVMGVEPALSFCRIHQRVDAVLIDKHMAIHATPGMGFNHVLGSIRPTSSEA